jgi:N-acetylneuraminic acid mutarotase
VVVDPSTGRSQPRVPLALAVHDAAGVQSGRKTLVFGGGGPGENGTAVVQRVVASGPTVAVGRLPAPRSDSSAAVVGAKSYVMGGFDGATWVRDVLVTTDGASFRAVAVLPIPVRYAAVAAVGTAIYIFGGVVNAEGEDSAAVQRLDTTTNTISVVGQLPATLSHASAVAFGSRVLLLGGFVNGNRLTDQILLYDTRGGSTTVAAHLPAPSSDGAAVAIGRRAYLLGGEGAARTPTASVTIVATR